MTVRELRGKTAVITGAGSGIGRAAALAFAGEGVNIVCVDIDTARAAATAHAVIALGTKAVPVTCDVTQESDLQKVRAAALEAFGRIDILMNNVGTGVSGRFLDIEMKYWRRALEVNFLAPVRAVQLMLPDMQQ
jgi:NAD(P)-dependent dehydrogenase (short-subunit alcohol dehydrogenase family)